jgi:hypothetical protein
VNSLSDLLTQANSSGSGTNPLAFLAQMMPGGGTPQANPSQPAPVDPTGSSTLPAGNPGVVLARLKSGPNANLPTPPAAGKPWVFGGTPDVRGMSKGSAFATGLGSGLKDASQSALLAQQMQGQNFQNQLALYKTLFDMQHQNTEEGFQRDTLSETRRKDLAAEDPALQEKLAAAKAAEASSKWSKLGETIDALGNKKDIMGYPPPAPKDASDEDSSGGADKKQVTPEEYLKQRGVNNTGSSSSPMSELQGQDFIDELNRQSPGVGDYVKGITEGRFAGTGRQLQKLMPLAAHYEPGFTAQDYQTRLATAKDFDAGKSAVSVKAANQAISHAQTAMDLIPKLGNYTYFPGIANPLHRAIAGQTDPEYQSNLAQFRTSINALGGELAKSFRGDRSAERDVQDWRQSMNELDSPEGIAGGVTGAMKLLGGALDALGDQYNRGMKSSKDPIEFLSPKNQETFKRLSLGGKQPESGESDEASAPAFGGKSAFASTPSAPASPISTPQGTPTGFGGSTPAVNPAIPQEAIEKLMANPHKRADFDSHFGKWFGPGQSDAVLGPPK